MENNEEFKKVVNNIKQLEHKLQQVDEKVLEQENSEAEKEIKEHFAQCVNALAARQEELLREFHEQVSKRSMFSFLILLLY